MDNEFFVMLTTQNGGCLIMTDETGYEPAIFESEEAARKAAKENILGSHFGYEIFERGCGI
jgi:hypothetical protein